MVQILSWFRFKTKPKPWNTSFDSTQPSETLEMWIERQIAVKEHNIKRLEVKQDQFKQELRKFEYIQEEERMDHIKALDDILNVPHGTVSEIICDFLRPTQRMIFGVEVVKAKIQKLGSSIDQLKTNISAMKQNPSDFRVEMMHDQATKLTKSVGIM